MVVTSPDRWKQAQSFEKGFWTSAAKRIREGVRPPLTYHKWRSENLMNLVTQAFPDKTISFANGRILEVGSGPVGAVTFMEARERIAVDPLCDFYATQPELVEHRSKDVRYETSRGEELAFDDKSMDLVIIENVIDHVQNADKVMTEIHRVLKDDGILYLTVNLHPVWGAFLHEILAALQIDRGHPHTFTLAKIVKFLNRHQFDVKFNIHEDYKECKRTYLKTPGMKHKLAGILGLTEYLYTSVSTKSRG
jgi:ubiquinone/menaquinone biosynthesis C-methylase UbiE